MQELDDNALLREYVERNSGPAFAELVNRHIDKVYSVALRHTGNQHQAEEITQAVFVILARKASGFRQGVTLEGWLYQTARLTALTHVRSEIRRARREQEALMQTEPNDNEPDAWTQIAPLLDAALALLNETDRTAVVMRFFYDKSLREIGTALGANEDSARMRINRALEKLRKFFAGRGVNSTAATIAGAISTHSVQTAPAALSKSVAAMVIAKNASASGPTFTLIKGALKTMAWTKTNTAIVAAAIVILAAGTTTVVVEHSRRPSPPGAQSMPTEKQRFDAETARLINNAKISAIASFHFAKDHQGQWPTNFPQLHAADPDVHLSDSDWEFVSGGNRANNDNPTRTVIFRERTPRRSPDGSFVRVYAFADFSIQVLTSSDGDFATLEKQNGYVVGAATN